MELQSKGIKVQCPGRQKMENKHLQKTLKKAGTILKNLCPIYHSTVPLPMSAAPPQISLALFKNFSLHPAFFLSLTHFLIFMICWRAPHPSKINPLSFPSAFSLFVTPNSTTKAQGAAFKTSFYLCDPITPEAFPSRPNLLCNFIF